MSRRESNWRLEGDNLEIYYPLDYSRTIDMVDLIKNFLLNLHENREIGYQEETCVQLFAQLQSWNSWSTCQDDQGNIISFGKGNQLRTRGCSATAQDGTIISFTLDDGTGKWVPANLDLWKQFSGNDFVEADCHCKGNEISGDYDFEKISRVIISVIQKMSAYFKLYFERQYLN